MSASVVAEDCSSLLASATGEESANVVCGICGLHVCVGFEGALQRSKGLGSVDTLLMRLAAPGMFEQQAHESDSAS